MVNGSVSEIPRPVGKLSYYRTNLSPGQREVKVDYIASDVSGVYKVVGEAYYQNELKVSKEVKVIVKIPDLREFNRQGYDNSGNMTWNVLGQTMFHTKNNYIQYRAGLAFSSLAYKIKEKYAENNGGDNGFIVRVTEMSLPWGGMFWIGYMKDTDLTITRVDGYGNECTITYRANTDYRIYAPPHRTHRDGRDIDISFYSDDGWGNRNENRFLDEGTLQEVIEEDGNFTYIREGDHYHFTCNLGRDYYSY